MRHRDQGNGRNNGAGPVILAQDAWIIFISCLLAACIDLSVYGPYEDYSKMANDFISESVKKNLRGGQPFGDKGNPPLNRV